MNPTPMTTSAATGRAAAQVGLPGLLINLAFAFHWIHWDAGQTAAVLGVATVAGAFLMRVVENWSGHGFLRIVPPKKGA